MTALTALEVASGIVVGRLTPSAAPPRATVTDPVAALEDSILPCLRRPPCLVSFSGGRDSSAVLARAVALARREALPPPIPATNRFPDAAGTDETEWQERIVSHLGLDDWVRLSFDDELDCLGPVARAVLLRHGVLWPCNAHFHEPILAVAAGGSLLTGIGGDELLSPPRPAVVASGRCRPEGRDVLRLGFHAAPRFVRRAVVERRLPPVAGWLVPEARRVLVRALAADAASDSVRWPAWARAVLRLRYLHVGTASLALLADDHDVRLVHPFLDARTVEAVASLPRRRRFPDRTAAMHALAGDLLPGPALARVSKARFDSVFWGEASRTAAAAWDGLGAGELVDPLALRDTWASERPDPRSLTLLQALWLSARREADEPGARVAERVGAPGPAELPRRERGEVEEGAGIP